MLSRRLSFALAVALGFGCGRTGYDPRIANDDAGAPDGDIDDAVVDSPSVDLAETGPVDMPTTDAADASTDTMVVEPASIVVAPTSGLVTTELGGTATFTVVLGSAPTDDVVISLTSTDTTEGIVSPAIVTFTTANWNAPHVVTVTGVDDLDIDGNQTYAIATAAATSTDARYDSLNADDVSASNVDNESAGVTLNRTSGLLTTEAGSTDTFTISLNVAPTADVTIDLSSSNAAESSVSPATITFTTMNWASPQTITATGIDDAIEDGDASFSIITSAAMSADVEYDGLDIPDVSGTNLDDESAGIVVMPTSGLVTSEAGGTASFTVVLQSEPTADVMLPISSSDAGEGTPSTSAITFSPTNWNVPQSITVTGVDDASADGDQIYTIQAGPTASLDADYNGLAMVDVAVTNTDDESAGIDVSPLSGLVTTEGGGTATFAVVLRSLPSATVQLSVASSMTSEGTVTPATLSFTTSTWDTPQIVTMAGVDDVVADGDQAYEAVVHVTSSADSDYAGLSDRHVLATNTDDETAGITVSPTSGLVTTESGGTATFTITLNSQPTEDVSISLASDVPLEGTTSVASLTFTSATWSTPQTVTVTGADDDVADGARVYHIVTANAVSLDANYSGLPVNDVTVTNSDDDMAGVTVSPTSGLTTTEAGSTTSFTVVLTSQPTANVTTMLASSDTTEGTVSPASLTFTMSNWATPQTVVITGVDDSLADGSVPYVITTSATSSADALYNAIDPSDVMVTNTDNEMASIVVSPTSGLVTTEAGGTATFDVVLTAQPTSNVVISLASSDATEGTVSDASLTFTMGNWNLAQTVTVTGADDSSVDGSVVYSIVTGAASSADSAFSGLAVSDVSVTNSDDDTAGVSVTPTLGLVTTEAGGTATFNVVLTSQPSANVVIGLTSSNLLEGTVSPASLTFTMGNWATPQIVTITGVDDALADGNIAYTIVTAAAVSSDLGYSAMAVADVSVTNNDNDAPGVNVSPTAGLVTTEAGAMATFTVVLASMPTASVSIGLTSSDTTEGTVSPASVTFTTGNWNMAQTVTITGVNDALDDGDIVYSIVTGDATSTDPGYSGRVVVDVGVTNADNDTASASVTPTSGLTTTELGGTATFDVVLAAQPTADVTISLASSDTTEATVGAMSLTFTNANWNMTQTVTVTGVDDSLDDGNVAYSITTGAMSSADLAFHGVAVSDVTATNTDNDASGVTVNPTSGVSTTEAGGNTTFTVVLNAQPTADVTIALSSSNTLEGTVSPASLTFTSMNWNMTQSVTVTGVNDSVDDGDIAYTIVTGAASSADINYNGVAVSDVSVTNIDNDTAAVNVSPTSGLVTTEAGGTDSFTIVLASQPTAGVSISLASTNTSEGTVGPASVSFTTMNWSIPQIVTLTGVNDFVDDGNVSYSITTGAAVSADSNYSGLAVSDVSASNTDNDTAGVTVNPTSGLTTTEALGTAMFTMVLTAQPTSNVTISIASSDTTEGTVSAASITFTMGNWNMAQTITVTGVNDSLDDGDVAYTVTTGAASSSDSAFNGLAVSDVSVTNTDDDTAGVTVSPTSGLATTEAGASDTFTLVLNAQPSADVTISLSSNDTTEGTVSPASVTFTNANWNSVQTVTVTGADDGLVDGTIAYTILTGATVSADMAFNGVAVADVSASNSDNDVVGVTVNPTSGLVTTEAGATAMFTVVLTSQPTSNVVISIASSDTSEGSVSTSSLTFTAGDWNSAQTVTVTGMHDFHSDGDVAYSVITGDCVSGDTNYSGLVVSDVSLTNQNTTGSTVYVKASNTAASDEFGNTVALSGDGNTMAITAHSEDSNATGIDGNQSDNSAADAGAVYVYVRSGGVWTQQAYIKASNTGGGDRFGFSLALSSDGSTLVVGAYLEDSVAIGIGGNQADNTAADAGAVYVFTRSGSTWSQHSYIKASNSEAGDWFGYSVAISADGSTMAVSSLHEDCNIGGINVNQANNASNNSGAVFGFVLSGGVWTQQVYIKAHNQGMGDDFGWSLALSSNGDTLAVGAKSESSNATGIGGDGNNNSSGNSGATYVFLRTGVSWAQQAYVKASNTGSLDSFGYSVSLSADGNTLAVGANYEASAATGVGANQADNTASGAGAVYIFTRAGAVWSQQAYIKASATGGLDFFGWSVSLSSDGNVLASTAEWEDGNATGVGGDETNNGTNQSGGAFVFRRALGMWTQDAYIKATNTGLNDFFGFDGALSADGATLAIGAVGEDSNATGIGGDGVNNMAANSGSAYVYH